MSRRRSCDIGFCADFPQERSLCVRLLRERAYAQIWRPNVLSNMTKRHRIGPSCVAASYRLAGNSSRNGMQRTIGGNTTEARTDEPTRVRNVPAATLQSNVGVGPASNSEAHSVENH